MRGMTRRTATRGVAPGVRRGVALPLLAVGIAGGGALWLAGLGLSGHASPPSAAVRERLLGARRALLAHAAAYPEHYGPRGAGPGHLPCPDTDRWPPSRGAARGGGTFDGEGPDPPCGEGAVAVGWLPRQVSLPSHREPFHHESARRLLYAVSTTVINNPLDRVVNPAATLVGGGGDVEATARARGDPVVALIVAPDLARADAETLARAAVERIAGDAGGAQARLVAGSEAQVALGRRVLIESAARRTAAWFVERATARAAARAAEGGCGGERGVLCWPSDDTNPLRTGASGGASEAPPPGPPPPLRWIDDGFGAGARDPGEPGEGEAPPRTIESVPLARHWFVRNGWHRFVRLEIAPRCRDAAAPCRLRVLRSAPRIVLGLRP